MIDDKSPSHCQSVSQYEVYAALNPERPSYESVPMTAKLNAVARQLNERPRKTLNYETPAERFSQCVASTG